MATLADNMQLLPESDVLDAEATGTSQAGSVVEDDEFLELLPIALPDSPGDLRAIENAWEHLFARAARGPFGLADAQATLNDIDTRWTRPDGTMLLGLIEHSTAQLKALAERERAAEPVPTVVKEAAKAAADVQFCVVQLFAASQAPAS